MNLSDITLDRLLTYAFCMVVILVGAAAMWSKVMTGDAFVTLATWITGAVVLGHAAGVAASGFVISAQTKAATLQKELTR